jgi:hypothetical protein
MADLSPALRAYCDLHVPEVREYSGRHEYDGRVQDLSPAGVRAGLAALVASAAARQPLADRHDEAQLAAFIRRSEVEYSELELHRRNPIYHLMNLDLSSYDREYAPAAERDAARKAHLAAWPDAIDGAVSALDRVSAPIARAMSSAVAGLPAGVPADADEDVRSRALAAHGRLTGRLERAAASGDPDPALGAAALSLLLGSSEAIPVDLGRLAERADAERDRLVALLAESCAAIDASRAPLEVARDLVREHPDASGVMAAARVWTERAIEFTKDRDLVPYHDGECIVGPAPESRRFAMAMISPAAPGEADAPSLYYITPPDQSWPQAQQEEWLEVFSDTTLPAITVHEVAPGHFSHARAIRRTGTEVRRVLHSSAFVEGWAHYAEELCVEEGFLGGDPRFAIGVWLEALIRVTRLACSIGVHSAGMSVEEAARRFETDTHLSGPAALSEARRATFDPSYGRYTWGKLEIIALRDKARREWGAGFTLRRFHAALLSLGSPALGLLGAAIEAG